MYRVRITTPFGRIMNDYSGRKGVWKETLRFLLGGENIVPNQTIADLGLEDDDQVDVFLAQKGC